MSAKKGQPPLHAIEPLIGHLLLTSVAALHTAGITANEEQLARPMELVVQGGLLEREEAMALLTPVPLHSALLADG
ncbi:hypothetical protein PV726_46875 [Streptomyces europaeiscabiei]|uniref:hypothetical protein n=1 Tax=Streptomyces europaeiscabiei TaxID=146819 RepID=UPI0029ADB1CF|nr:hypothetical protein [Streptomyces europaeiscabiei]MDX3697588.1 hypothetical protein [Streptomyces europaeiscabiei]